MSPALLLKIHANDNVAVALTDLCAGTVWEGVHIRQKIPRGHKLALASIPTGAMVIKYGAPIGHATVDLRAGDWVHTHTLKTNLDGALHYDYDPCPIPLQPRPSSFFRGYVRADGRVGIRNEIWILPTVGCMNGVAEAVARKAQTLLHGSVDGVYAFVHPYGCSQLGEDYENTRRALCGLARHPNTGGVLLLGLGCESNDVDGMLELLSDRDPRRLRAIVAQEHSDEVCSALALVSMLVDEAAGDERTVCAMSRLVVGLKCGGSDGLSGITANPLVGAFSDLLLAEGGAALLTEVPEMFGAETRLMNRCPTRALFDQTVELINDFKEYYLRHGQVVYENPSPGNKEGGITTLEEKSLGCVQKGGTAPVAHVLRYGEPAEGPGLHLLQAPGNDLVASTAQAVAGAQLILFTTGRGTPFGAPVPTVKLSSNTELYTKKPGWIDFDAGTLVAGATLQAEAERLYTYVNRLANGEIQTKTEENGIRDLAIFKNGVTL